MDKIRKIISDKKIWVSIDETTDVQGRYIANVIVGTLEENNAGNIFLLNSKELEKANYSTITKLFDRSMSILWPARIQHDNVLLFLSDAAPCNVWLNQEKNDAVSIKDAQDNIIKPGLENNLTYIKSNFAKLTLAIEQLQRQHMHLSDSLKIVQDIQKSFETLSSPNGKAVQKI
ncbi:hypothetical protein QTP88_025374 [Uroleucon formosanum]